MLDFSGVALVDATGYDYKKTSSQTVTGLYAQIDIAFKSGKLIMLGGWNYNNVPMSPTIVYVMPATNAYVVNGKINVSNVDAVTVL